MSQLTSGMCRRSRLARGDRNGGVSAAGGAAGELRIADLVGALGKDRAKLGAARKALERLERQAAPLAPPLPSQVRARKERQAGCETLR